MRSKFHTSGQKYVEFESTFGTDEVQEKMADYKAFTFDWNAKKTIHIHPPIVKKDDFSIVTECALRAFYLACLIECEKQGLRSVAFPLLGYAVSDLRSVSIAIQTAYAYMQSVERTNIELIYIVSSDTNRYQKIAEHIDYIREFDLRHWTREKYFKFEDRVFNKLKSNAHYATVPGTDMVFRAFKYSSKRGMTTKNKKLCAEIGKKMCELTSFPLTEFSLYSKSGKKATCGRVLPCQHIENGFGTTEPSPRYEPLISTQYPANNICGSNEMLRKLWIISRYVMYYSANPRVGVQYDDQTIAIRKQLCIRMMNMHEHVLREWARTIKFVPHECDCGLHPLETVAHPKLIVFGTKMSHYDAIFDTWFMHGKEVLINSGPSNIARHFNVVFSAEIEDEFSVNSQIVNGAEELEYRLEFGMLTYHMQHERRKEFWKTKGRLFWKVLGACDLLSFDTDLSRDTLPECDHYAEIFEQVHGEEVDEVHIKDRRKQGILDQKCVQLDRETGTLSLAGLDLLDGFELHWFSAHDEDCYAERQIRARAYKKYTLEVDSSNERFWKEPFGNGDVYLYLSKKWDVCEEEQLAVPEEDADQSFCSAGSAELPESDDSEDDEVRQPVDIVKYPPLFELGEKNVECDFCGALFFSTTRVKSCCKNGAVWIPPLKKMPSVVAKLFDTKRHRDHVISINGAFSMASISYTRQAQAKFGVQSMKVRGGISFHPSALHPHNPANPRFANFIVLEHGNDEIARMRFDTIAKSSKQLMTLFEDLQAYFDKHNDLYKMYKNMVELEKEYMKDANCSTVDNTDLVFRIVPVSELDEEDMKELIAHKGVYAAPSRISKSYISVAFTHDAEQSVPRAKCLQVYPKNPTTGAQFPIPSYSGFADPLCYTLLFPDGLGGYGYQKYIRHTLPGPKPTLKERIENHCKELVEKREDPHNYYEAEDVPVIPPPAASVSAMTTPGASDLSDDDVEMADVSPPSTVADEPMSGSEESVAPASRAKSVDGDRTEEEDSNSDSDDDGPKRVRVVSTSSEESEVEEDPNNLSNDQILLHGAMEDMQEAPLQVGEIGQRTRMRVVERKGDRYMMVDRENPTEDIPLVWGNPFGEKQDEEPSILNQAEHPDDVVQEFEGADKDLGSVEGMGEADDIEVSDEQGGQNGEDVSDGELPEAVTYGDEHQAEATELGRANGGKKVVNKGKRKHVSTAEYGRFILKTRKGRQNRFQGKAGKLGQLYAIDLQTRAMEQRMAALTEHRAEFWTAAPRSKVFKHYQACLKKALKDKKRLGMLVTMPSTVPGTSKYQRELVMSAVTIANRLGNPHLFITFTGSPEWKEITSKCAELNCEWSDIPDHVNQVFRDKFDKFLEKVVGEKYKSRRSAGKVERRRGIFGHVKWYNYSVEFQQRGMPHVHLLVALKRPITTAAQVDAIIKAQVPDMPDPQDPEYAEKLRYYNLVKDKMVHFPCAGQDHVYCNVGKTAHQRQCTKGFPKRFSDSTVLIDDNYPMMKRLKRVQADKFRLFRDRQAFYAGDEYVVSHNPQLLMMFECHINVEVVASIRTMKYMFKYIHKGSDRVLLEAAENMENGKIKDGTMTMNGNVFAPASINPGVLRKRQKDAETLMDRAGVEPEKGTRVALNDCSYFLDLSAMTACEASWKLNGFPMHGCSHIVHRAYVHEEGEDLQFFPRGVGVAEAGKALKKKPRGMLAAWFDANKKNLELPRSRRRPNRRMTNDLTLPEMFEYYKFDMQGQKFVLRKKDWSSRIIGRIQAPQQRYLNLTAVRLLALHVKGPTSWEDLRTYEGVTYDTCLEAARARRLMNGQQEWDDVIKQIAETEGPNEVRRAYVSVLVNAAPANPRELWDDNWEHMINRNPSWTKEQKQAQALRHVSFLLARHGMTLRQFELDDIFVEDDLPVLKPHEDVDNPDVELLTEPQHQKIGDDLYVKLNVEQKKVVDRALEMAALPADETKLLFIDGPGGTGKTFTYRTVYHQLRAKKKKVLCVAHTGIAACLLPGGCTAHRKFSIPIEVSDQMTCSVSAGSEEGDALARTDAIIWDEACMTDRRIFDSVSILFQLLKNNDRPFGGVLLLMGGDWRQILPIVEGVRGAGVVDFILKRGEMWQHVEKFWLTKNHRAATDPEFAKMILEIGDGVNFVNEKRQMIRIPEENVERRSETALVDWVFPDVNDLDATKTASVLTMDNKTALRLNDMIIKRLDGKEYVFTSEDTPDKDNGLSADPEVFSGMTPQGMPPHILRLKVGAQVVLLRNLCVEDGLCNGTRLTVTKIDRDLIECTMNSSTDPVMKTFFLHRMRMTPTGKGATTFGFSRLQFPIRLAYAQTVNKSQGQTLSRCGLVVTMRPFSHGQIYVAISRVKRSEDFKMWHFPRKNRDDYYPGGGLLVRNVVIRDALREPVT